MNLKEIYDECNKYDFSKLDICSKDEAITTLICHIKKISLSKFYLVKNEIVLTEEETNLLFDFLDKLIYDNIPIQYIIGEVELYREKYIVMPSVLIPRQDTEILIEKAIEYIDKFNLKTGLDLCSGSGAIGISTCNNSTLNSIHFIDISKDALEITKKNIEKNNIQKETLCINSDLFENLMTSGYKYDIIMSNPPYIPTKDIHNLSKYVKSEPTIALDGGGTGLVFYEKIINEAREFLNDKGYLMFEIGYNQMEDLTRLFNRYPEYEIIEKIKDLNYNDRVIICRFHKI